MKNDLHTLENYTYELNIFDSSIVFGHFRQEMKFCSLLEKNPEKFHKSKEKAHVGWLVLTQKNYPLKFGSCPVFYEITVFSLQLINMIVLSLEKSYITRSFWING